MVEEGWRPGPRYANLAITAICGHLTGCGRGRLCGVIILPEAQRMEANGRNSETGRHWGANPRRGEPICGAERSLQHPLRPDSRSMRAVGSMAPYHRWAIEGMIQCRHEPQGVAWSGVGRGTDRAGETATVHT